MREIWLLVKMAALLPAIVIGGMVAAQALALLLGPLVMAVVAGTVPWLIACGCRALQLKRMAKALGVPYSVKVQTLWLDHSVWTKADWRLEATL